LNGHPDKLLPNTLNVSFEGVDSDRLLAGLPEIAASTGAACHAHSREPSAVLTAMGVPAEMALGAVRFSLGRRTASEEIGRAVDLIASAVSRWHAARASGS
jgi:cysteine desulfurase